MTIGLYNQVLSYHDAGFYSYQFSQYIGAMLSYDALNPTHVPFYAENSCTLGSSYTPRTRRVDIEVPILE